MLIFKGDKLEIQCGKSKSILGNITKYHIFSYINALSIQATSHESQVNHPFQTGSPVSKTGSRL